MSSAILIAAADLNKYLFRNHARVHKWTSRTLTYQSLKREFFVPGVVFQFNHNEQTIPSVGPVRLQYETIYTLGMATTAMSPQVV